MTIQPRLTGSFKKISRFAGVSVIAIGCIVLAGWVFDIEMLRTFLPGFAPMKFNTAVAFILSGITLVLLHVENPSLWQRRIRLACAVIVALVGLLTLSEYLFGWNLGIDQWFIQNAATTLYPARMTPMTAFNFLLVGIGLLILNRSHGYQFAQLLTLVVGALSLLAIVGYLYGVEAFYSISPSEIVALHTALTFAILCTGLLFARPEQGFTRTLTTDSAGGLLARRLLPGALLIPIVVGWLRLRGQQIGLYDTEIGLSLFTLSNILIFLVLIGWIARSLHHIDLQRQAAEAALRRVYNELEQRVEERTAELTKASKALEYEHNLLRTLIDNLPDFIYAKDTDSRFILNNIAHAHSMGKTNPDELVGKNDFDFFPQEMAAQFYADEQSIIHSGEPMLQREEPSLGREGQRIWASTTKVPLRDAAGKIIGIVGLTRDITEQKNAETALQENEERYRTLVRNLPNVVVNMFDHDLRYTLSEGTTLARHGFDPSILEGKTIWEALRPERAALHEPIYRAALAGKETTYETENDGFTYRVTVVPVKDEHGEIVGGLSVSEDITQRKQSEAALHEIETQYRLVARATNDIIWDWNLVTNKLEWSDALQSQFDYAPELVKNDFEWWSDKIHPDDRERIISSMSSVIEAGGQFWTQEYRFRRFDDTYALVIDRGFVSRDDTGKPIRMIGSMMNITERKAIEERLLTERKVLRTLIDALPDYIFVKDATGRFVVSNMAHALAVQVSNPDDLVGKYAADVFPPDLAAQFDADDQAIMRSGEPLVNLERQTVDAAGNPIWVATTKVPLLDEKNQVTGLVGISRDITERRRAEQYLQVQYAATQILAEASTLTEASNRICRLICESLQWEVGEVWMMNKKNQELRCLNIWHIPSLDITDFERVTHSAEFSPNTGMPARIWNTHKPDWVSDVTAEPDFDRASLAAELGLRSAFGFPVLMGDLPMGMWVFFSRAVQQPDEHLLEMMAAIGKQVGQFVERQQAEAALRESEGRLRSLFEDSPISLWEQDMSGTKAELEQLREAGVIDFRAYFDNNPEEVARLVAKAKVLDVNRATLALYQAKNKEELLGSLSQSVIDSDIESNRDYLVAIAEGKTHFEGEFTNFTANGMPIQVTLRWTAAPGYEDSLSRVLVSIVDITEQKQAAAALRESETRFRFLFEYSPDAIFLLDPHAPNVSWPIVDCNAAACVMNGYSRQELIGQTIDILHEEPGTRSERAAYLEQLRQATTTNSEAQHRRKDGSIFNIQVRSSLLNLNGRELVLGIDRDITEQKRAAAALQQSEERFRATFEQAAVGMAHTGTDGRWLRVNQKLCDILGYTREEILELTWFEITYIDDLTSDYEQNLQLLMGEISTYSMEKRYVRKDGSLIWVNVTLAGVRDTAGEYAHTIAVIEDISERKRTETALQESEERYRATFEQASVGVAFNDNDGRFIWVNQKYCDILGYSRDEILELTWQQLTHPDDVNMDWELAQQLLADEISHYSIEKRYIRKDGSVVWTSMTTSLLRDASGDIKHGVVVAEDISERKRASEALAESEERFRAIVDQAAVGISYCSLDGHWLRVNQKVCDILDYTPEELFKHTFQDITHPDDVELDLKYSQQLISGEIPTFTIEKRYIRSDGTPVWVNLTVSLLRRPTGEASSLIGIIEDITARKQAEAALAMERNLLRTLIDNLPDYIFVKDTEGRFITTNEAGWRGFGVSTLEDLIGKTDFDFLPYEIAAGHQALEQEVVQSGQTLLDKEEMTFERVSARYLWILTSKMPLRDSDGNIYGLVGISRDITARKEAEAALRESEERFRAIFEQAAVGIAQTNMSGHYLSVNQRFCDIIGYTREELQHLTWRDITYPNDLADDEAHNRQLLAGELHSYTLEKRYIRKDQSLVWINLTSALIRGPSGEAEYMIAVIEDISQRKQAQEAVRESEERFRQLAENVNQVFWLRDPVSNRMLYVSPAYAKVWGRTPASLVEEPLSFMEAVYPEDQERVWARYKFHAQDGFDDEYRINHTDGSVRWVWVRTFPVLNERGEMYRIVGLAEDITARKQMEFQKLELESERTRIKVVERFISDASHDLRTPLTIMQTSLYLLEKNTDPEKRKRHADNLNEQISHITRVLEDFLNLGRLDQLMTELKLEPLDLSATIHAIRAEQQPLAVQKHHQVNLKLASDLTPIMADKTELERALRHLIVNAMNYTPDGGQIILETRQENGRIVFEIRDNGIGISPQDLPFIFERFYRADKARDIATGGSGLGLAIAKKVIEAHGGNIEVESSPGSGSVFRVRLDAS